MNKDVFEKIIKNVKDQKVTLVLDLISSNGGYSSSNPRLVLDLTKQKIKCYDDYIEIKNLIYTKAPNWSCSSATKASLFNLDVDDEDPIDTLFIEYDIIKAIGL